VYLKKSELILQPIGSAGGIPPEPPFYPPRLEAEAKRSISGFGELCLLPKFYQFFFGGKFFFKCRRVARSLILSILSVGKPGYNLVDLPQSFGGSPVIGSG
jgi:hypothetical protein